MKKLIGKVIGGKRIKEAFLYGLSAEIYDLGNRWLWRVKTEARPTFQLSQPKTSSFIENQTGFKFFPIQILN